MTLSPGQKVQPNRSDLARRVERVLQLDVERAGTEAAPVPWAEDLDVAYRVEPKALWDALLHDRQQLSHSLFRVRRADKVEVTAVGSGEIGHQAVVDPMRVDDDPVTLHEQLFYKISYTWQNSDFFNNIRRFRTLGDW